MKIPTQGTRTLAFWGLSHALADATTGFLLFSLGAVLHVPLAELALLFLLYNGVGFGFQPLMGLMIDRLQRPHLGAALGVGILAAVNLLWPLLPSHALWGWVLIAALASALFHVSAGGLCLRGPQPLLSAGCFAAPGVLGLSLGIWAALQSWSVAFPLGLALCFSSLSFFWQSETQKQAILPLAEPVKLSEKQELWLLGLLFAIALRSFFWNRTQLQSPGDWLLWLGMSACLGKLAGGCLAQRWGLPRVVWPSSVMALLCLILPSPPLWLTCLGVAALQSSSPLTLSAVGQILPGRPALAAGLALGLALALGGVPLLIQLPGLGLP
ncbi:MAG: hypothetical protein AB7I41_08645 [Candidatus Sericytochromatia bacterium]